MLSKRHGRCRPNLTQLEDRWNPAITVFETAWNPELEGTLPWAIEEANATAGQDEIVFNWNAIGNQPIFTVDPNETLAVTEGVIIQAGGGNVYAKFTGFRPFNFTHMLPAPAPIGQLPATDSVINGGYFDGCNVGAGEDGGALKVMAGTLTLNYNRFIGNQASTGGAVYVGTHGTLFVGAAQGQPPAPTAFPEVIGSSAVLFKSNQAGNEGGAIVSQGGHVKLYRAFFHQNKAGTDGGGVHVSLAGTIFAGAPAGSGITPEVSFVKNEAQNGGGVYHSGAASSISASAFTDNQASGDGGGIYASGDLTITGGSFTSNDAVGGSGGAIRVLGATVDITDASVTDNTAGGFGGGIAVGSLTLGGTVNSTGVAFSGNLAGVLGTGHWGTQGAGVFNEN